MTGRHFFELTDKEFEAYHYHVESFRRLPSPGRALEVGAGSNLLTPLLLSAAGASEVFTYDIERIATVEQVNHVIRQLRSRMPGEWEEVVDLDEDLFPRYRIRYCAPGDARRTGLPECSVDFFCSTSTLEHIPSLEISSILSECKRIASPHALFSFVIDYHDHYATADAHISRFNFYRYSERAWRWFNPANHYQNRLRHSDYTTLFDAGALNTIEARRVMVPTTELEGVPLSQKFLTYPNEELAALNGLFLLSCRTR